MVVVNLTCESADWQSVISCGCSQWEVLKGEFVCVCVESERAQPFENFQNLFCDAFCSLLICQGLFFGSMDEACI